MIIPKEVKSVIGTLKNNGFDAYVVGGCVRDVLRGVDPDDWDITTDAKPEEIQKIFPKNFYENKFLTVTVQTDSKKQELKEIEITTYRSEAKYTDKRHPEEIRFAKTLEEDLSRRDFTVNAIAIGIKNKKLMVVDPFTGQEDLKNKIIKAVGNPEERFSEDALRMMRAVRLATTLNQSTNDICARPSILNFREKFKCSGFTIEPKTAEAIKKNAKNLEEISAERIRDEFLKIVMAERAADGIELLRELKLLKHIVPELEEGYGVTQNKHHIYGVYEHSLLSFKYAAKNGFNKYVRLATLFHDIAKPRVKKGEGLDSTFYGHEMLGAKMAYQILNRLKFPKKDVEKITKLIRYHLFYYNVGEVGESSVRRLLQQAGPENINELLQVRMADRIGSGCPKAEPYKLRHLKYIMEKVSRDPISVKMLKVGGNDVMDILKISPGSKIGSILEILLGYVLLDPKKNQKGILKKEIEKLGQLPDDKLKKLVDKAKEEKGKIETKRDEMTKKKYWVT